MNEPQRIQRKRTKGWRMPEGAVYVGRGSKWGNPYTLTEMRGCYPEDDETEIRRKVVSDFRGWAEGRWDFATEAGPTLTFEHDPADLAGHDLACWCPLNRPCHADVLLELANKP